METHRNHLIILNLLMEWYQKTDTYINIKINLNSSILAKKDTLVLMDQLIKIKVPKFIIKINN